MNQDIIRLREVITKLVPLLSGRGLVVTQRGSQAYVATNKITRKPERVNIPNISENATPEFIRAIQGFIDHEVAHVLITDWDWYLKMPEGFRENTPREKAFRNVMNIIEDTMIEREIVKIFPGSRANISDTRKFFLSKISKPAVDAAKTDEERFRYLLVPVARALAGHEEMQDWLDENGYWANPLVKAFVDALPGEIKDALMKAKSTKDVFAIATVVFDILHPEKPAPQAQSAEGDEGDEGESQDKPEKKAGEGDGDGERDHSEEGEEEDDNSSDGEAGEQDEGGDDEDTDADDEGADEGTDDEDAETGEDAGDAEDGDDPSDDDAGDDDGSDESDAEGAGDEGGDQPENSDGDEDSDGGDDGDAGEQDDLNDEKSGAGSGATEGDEESGDSGDAIATKPSAGEDGGGVGSLDTDISGDDGKREQGGGVGNSLSRSLLDFDEDAFEGADTSAAIAAEISEQAGEVMADSAYSVFTRELDQIAPLVPPERIDDKWIPTMENTVRAMTGRMQKDIERMMASQSHVIRTPGHRKGKLHAPSLFRIPQGDDRVFSQKQEHVSKDTAVTLLVDNSGSMAGSKCRLAMIAAYALCSTLDRVKIANEVIGFTTGMSYTLPPGMQEAYADECRNSGVSYDRVIPIVMPIYKSFDERLSATVKKRIAYMMNAQRGLAGNIDGESLEYAAERIMRRSEKRKVILVLSDGQPAGSRRSGPHLKYTAERIEKIGIECVGIGIMDNSVKKYYKRNAVLHNIADLPSLVMGEIKRILTS